MSELHLCRYTAADAAAWDALIGASRNGTFLFARAYMDYHADRFADHSLLFRDAKGALVAVLPANATADGHYCSHQGLTYGGFVLSYGVHAADVMQLFDLTIDYLRRQGFTHWHYKSVPTVFQSYPSQDDEYALWRHEAQLDACLLSAALDLRAPSVPSAVVSASKRNNTNRLQRQGFRVVYDAPLELFWPILEETLRQTYDAKPVHTLAEMQRLKAAFPRQIVCCLAVDAEGKPYGGTVLYVMPTVAHAQYMAASAQGKQNKAMDFLMMWLIQHFREETEVRYFDFGTSNEQGGHVLNESLILQKEGFGARGVTYKHWLLKL